ncbi:MAG: hypothetical protein KC933_20690 [Myxococcales bacterium]|nr:hypothetical protein [Myxococcales bacterium]MCB9648810.1 hypothetical protein [Deltaproteobacteria bacterium]
MTREWFARAPRAPEIDLELYAYDAPFDRPDAGEDAEEDTPEDSGAYALADQDFVDDWDPWGDEEEDDDALLAVLEEALDEVAEEERVAAIKAAASPEADTVEIAPEPGTLYRDAISALLGQPRRPSAPRYSQIAVRAAGREGPLEGLLQDSLLRARSSLERWRAKGWASDLPPHCTVTP